MAECVDVAAVSWARSEVGGYGRPAASVSRSWPKRNSVAESRVNRDMRSYIIILPGTQIRNYAARTEF